MEDTGGADVRGSGRAASFAWTLAAVALLVGLVATPPWFLGLLAQSVTGAERALELGLPQPPAPAPQPVAEDVAVGGIGPASARPAGDAEPAPLVHVADIPVHETDTAPASAPAVPERPASEVAAGMLGAIDPPVAAEGAPEEGVVVAPSPEPQPAPPDAGDAVPDQGEQADQSDQAGDEEDAGDPELAGLEEEWWADPEETVSRLLLRSGIAPQ